MFSVNGAIASAPLRLAPNGRNKQKLVCGFPTIRPLPTRLTRRSSRPAWKFGISIPQRLHCSRHQNLHLCCYPKQQSRRRGANI